MRVAAVFALQLLVAVAATWWPRPSNEADMGAVIPGDLPNEVGNERQLRGEKAQHQEAEVLRTRLHASQRSENMLKSMARLSTQEKESVKTAYQKQFANMIKSVQAKEKKLWRVAATCNGQRLKLNQTLKLTRRGLMQAQEQRSALEASLAQERGARVQLQTMIKSLSAEVTADQESINKLNLDDAAHVKHIQELVLEMNQSSEALNVAYAGQQHLRQQINYLDRKMQEHDNASKEELRIAEHTTEFLTEELDGVQAQLALKSTKLRQEEAEMEKDANDLRKAYQFEHKNRIIAEQNVSALEKELKELRASHAQLEAERNAVKANHDQALARAQEAEADRDQAMVALNNTKMMHAELLAAQNKEREDIQKVKAAYEKEILKLKAESEKGRKERDTKTIRKLRAEDEDLRNQLNETKEQLAEGESERRQLEQELAQSGQALQTETTELGDLRQELEHAKEEEKHAVKKFGKREIARDLARMGKKLNETLERDRTIVKEHDAEVANLTATEKSLEASKEKEERTEQLLNLTKDELTKALADTKLAKAALMDQETRTRSQQAARDSTVKTLKEDLAAAKAQVASLNDTLVKLQQKEGKEESEDEALEVVEKADDEKLKADQKTMGNEQKALADRDQAMTMLRSTLAAALMKVKSLNASKQQDDEELRNLATTDANDLKAAGEAIKNRDIALKYLKSSLANALIKVKQLNSTMGSDSQMKEQEEADETELKEAKQELVTAQQQLTQRDQIIGVLKANLMRAESKVEALNATNAELDEAKAQNLHLQQVDLTLEDDLKATLAQYKTVKEQMLASKKETEAAKADLIKMEATNKDVASHEEDKWLQSQKVSEALEVKLAQEQEANKKQAADIEASAELLATEQEKNKNMTEDLQDAKSELAQQQAKSKELATELQDVQSQLAQEQEKDKSGSSEVQAAKSELASEEQKDKAAASHYKATETQLAKEQKKSKNMALHLQATKSELAKEQAKSRDMESQLEATLAELNKLKEEKAKPQPKMINEFNATYVHELQVEAFQARKLLSQDNKLLSRCLDKAKSLKAQLASKKKAQQESAATAAQPQEEAQATQKRGVRPRHHIRHKHNFFQRRWHSFR
eukprot:gnl/TRDRNA2_/TRDRNA2_153058_c0_seq1.p1 gnl/TRDRNA2_/TRDRNA2_153058_c0~~gnl/TRDRNA2_/TRDRNA2_153058_c0_seq1.p1  ORF type:complete len:1107 (-),score=443.58 gnl/TRDRNA2_/TRDRNA2_153058_c0_seq1:72-3392(-)